MNNLYQVTYFVSTPSTTHAATVWSRSPKEARQLAERDCWLKLEEFDRAHGMVSSIGPEGWVMKRGGKVIGDWCDI